MQALKIAAIRGSLESLDQLKKLVDGELAAPGELLPIFCHHLNPKKIPCPDRPAHNMPMHFLKLAIAALNGITSCLNTQYKSQNETLLSDIGSHWTPKIWKWTRFLLVHYCAEPMPNTIDTKFKDGVYFATTELLVALVHRSDELCTAVASTPGVITLMTKLWIMETKKEYELLGFMASIVLGKFASEPKQAWRDQIIASTSDPSDIAKTILDRIRINFIEPSDIPTNYAALLGDLQMAMGFTVGPLTDVRPALWSQHSVTIITQAIFCLASDRVAEILSVPDSWIRKCIRFCASYLDISFAHSGDTYTWIVHAVEARLISALLKATRFFGHDDTLEPICSNILGHVIPQYLVYRSVLRSVARSLENIRSHGHEMTLTETGPFRDSWNTLNDVVTERLAIEAHDNEASSHVVCANPTASCYYYYSWL